MDSKVKFHIKRLCDYLEDEEHRHYEESFKPRNHIYRSVMYLRKILSQMKGG